MAPASQNRGLSQGVVVGSEKIGKSTDRVIHFRSLKFLCHRFCVTQGIEEKPPSCPNSLH